MVKPKYLITNLVYGETYTRLFVNNHLKSILDETNLPALAEKYDIEYLIFTDQPGAKAISYHPNTARLAKHCKVSSFLFNWPEEKVNKFAHRYSLLLNMFHNSVKKAIEDNALLTCWVADLVVAKEFFPRIMKRMDEGHGAVFVLPLRSAWRPIGLKIDEVPDALVDTELCQMGIDYLHPLWGACLWNNPMFTKLPFCLLWNTVGGMMARTFSTTPIIFKPKKEMLETRGMIDGDIPGLCDNPYWCTDWIDAPVIGVEPIECYWPPFGNRPASVPLLKEFLGNVHPSQIPFLEKRCYYPDEKTVQASSAMIEQSDKIVKEIMAE